MVEDPENIRQNIQHYLHLLTLYSTASSREQVLNLLAKTMAQLSHAEADVLSLQAATLDNKQFGGV